MANLFAAQAGGLGQLVECCPAHAVLVASVEHRLPDRVGGPDKAENLSGHGKMTEIEEWMEARGLFGHMLGLDRRAVRFAASLPRDGQRAR